MEIYNGIVEDPRSVEEKQQDWQHEEIASSAIPNWEEREPKKFPIFNQNGSSACVAFATAKILGIDEVVEGRDFIHLSPRDIYTMRQNKGGGMWLPNALDIAKNHGACTELKMPSEALHEVEMNNTSDRTEECVTEALNYRSKGYLELPKDIDSIASVIHQGKSVLLGFRFDYDEWTDFPTINPNSNNSCGHGVAAVDAVLKDGKKYIVIDDSWSPTYGIFGQRYISEEFLKEKCFYAGYTLNLIFETKHIFKTQMHFGDKNDEVKFLQDFLKTKGLFPVNRQSSGLFGAITKSAVKKFQSANGLKIDGWVGIKTLEVINKI